MSRVLSNLVTVVGRYGVGTRDYTGRPLRKLGFLSSLRWSWASVDCSRGEEYEVRVLVWEADCT